MLIPSALPLFLSLPSFSFAVARNKFVDFSCHSLFYVSIFEEDCGSWAEYSGLWTFRTLPPTTLLLGSDCVD
jgi:hypothetical protein